jgi:hypothetical protein
VEKQRILGYNALRGDPLCCSAGKSNLPVPIAGMAVPVRKKRYFAFTME